MAASPGKDKSKGFVERLKSLLEGKSENQMSISDVGRVLETDGARIGQRDLENVMGYAVAQGVLRLIP